MRRPTVSFLAWSFVPGRSAEIAHALGGEAKVIYDRRLTSRRLVPLRYVLSSVQTLVYLVLRRPRSVIVTLPPVFPGLVAWMYCRISGAPLVLDSHPSAFGRKGDRLSERLLPIHRWLARRATATMVTTSEWQQVVGGWDARAIVVHEAPPTIRPGELGWAPDRDPKAITVLFVCVFSPDEPVAAVLQAAALVPNVEVIITGDLRRAPSGLVEEAPPNVTFCGYLDPLSYQQALHDADAVLALTTEPTSVMRAAYEAVYAGRPLIATDQDVNRLLFEHAVLVSNDVDGVRRGLERVSTDLDALLDAAPEASARQHERWLFQLEELHDVLRVGGEA